MVCRSAFNWLWPVALVAALTFSMGTPKTEAETWGFMGGRDAAMAMADDGFAMKSTIALAPSDVSRIADAVIYTVKEGDNLSGIASEYGISVATIKSINNLYSDTVKPGQELTVIPVDGLLHRVGSNETVTSIAKKYQVEADEILKQNKLEDGQQIEGLTLIVPGAKPIIPKRTYVPTTRYDVADIYRGSEPVSGQLLKPASGVYTQYFSTWHAGLDIADPSGPTIYAASGGEVVEACDSGWNGGYGETVVIDHGDGLRTRYAHMRKVYVSVGDQVMGGQAIGQMGSTGRSSGTHVHFEVINNGTKQNPISYF